MSILSLKRQSRGLGLSPRRRLASEGGSGPPEDLEAPSVPQNLSATAISADQIDLTWDASTDNVGVTGYNVYRDDVLIDTSPTNAYADSGLDPATLYQYEVSAFDAASNESARSTPDSATTHQAIVTAGLVGEYRLDAGAGATTQTITDASGNAHHGTRGTTGDPDTADPAWTAEGLVFTGSESDQANFDNVGISGGVARTVIFAFRTSAAAGAEHSFGFRWGTSWTLRNTGTGDAAKVRLNAGANFNSSLDLGGAAGGAWHFLAVTQSGNNMNTCTLYLDGNAQAVTANPVINTTGAMNWGHNGSALQDMRVGYALVYDRALSAPEIAQNRTALTAIMAARGVTLP